MSEQCAKCEKEIDYGYHCIRCCANISSSGELAEHVDHCPSAAFLNPLDDN